VPSQTNPKSKLRIALATNRWVGGPARRLASVFERRRLAAYDEPSSSPNRCKERYEAIAEFLKPGGVGAEIGVFKGAFVDYLLSSNPSKLYLVDPWYLLAPEWDWAIGDPSTVRALRRILKEYQNEIASGLVEPHIRFSEEFLSSMPDNHFDWVYIDTLHEYEATIAELTLALKKVKPAGFIIGDDWVTDENHAHYGTYKAVRELEAAGKLQLHVEGDAMQYVASRCS